MFSKCTLPKYENPLKTPTDKILSIVSLGLYGVHRTHQVIDKYNKDMDEFHKCVLTEIKPKFISPDRIKDVPSAF